MAHPVLKAFQIQAEVCAKLGSQFTADLCLLFAENLTDRTEVGALCVGWQGDPGPSADSIPLRMCGGLHALVLTGRSKELAKFYPPNTPIVPDWAIVETALVEHEPFLLDWMKSPPQTNEVSRSGVIWPALMLIARETSKPLNLLEVGASGGLNLRLDHFAYDLGGTKSGQSDSAVQIEPDWRGQPAEKYTVSIAARRGCDLNPLDPTNAADALRLRAYVWPDQAARHERLNGAIALAHSAPADVARMDAVAWLEKELEAAKVGLCRVIYSTIAWQYLSEDARTKGEAIIREAAQAAMEETPLAWLRFEADSETPGAGITLSLWPKDVHAPLGRGDFHGRWVDWRGM